MTAPAEKEPPEEIRTPIDGHFYKLLGQDPVPCTFAEYAINMQAESNRIIAQNRINDWLVSTIFTGLDHSFGLGEKRLFETLIFGMANDIHPRWQYATWDDAVENHNRIVSLIEKEGIGSIEQQIRERVDL